MSDAIKSVSRGANLRCAVAFWGKDAVKTLFDGEMPPSSSRILCDISMGGSNPSELEALGAADPERVRHIRGLHAKVYMSDAGLVVGSANASDNGIGFLDMGAKLEEAGTFSARETKAWQAASAWFDALWRRSEEIDLQEVQATWSRRCGRGASFGPTSDALSLLDIVMANPARFRGVGFVFTSDTATTAQRNEAARAVIAHENKAFSHPLTLQEQQRIKNWKVVDVFSKWSVEEIRAWPGVFVSVHRDKEGAISYSFYERVYALRISRLEGAVLGRRRREIRRELGVQASAVSMSLRDAERLKRIYETVGNDCLFENVENLASVVSRLR